MQMFYKFRGRNFPGGRVDVAQMRFTPLKNIIKILKLYVMLYVSLGARRNFPISCQFYIVLCFKILGNIYKCETVDFKLKY